MVCIGARVLLTANLWTEMGLVNGATGIVFDLEWEAGEYSSTSLPSLILVKFDNYSRPLFPGCLPAIAPIFPVTRQFEYNKVTCSRQQFPLRLAYALTVYKSQGLTLSRVVLNLSQREHCRGLSYVAISRVKTLNGLLFESPFDFEHFTSIASVTPTDRELDIVERDRQLV